MLKFISKKQYKQNNVICKTILINDDIKRNFDNYMSKLWAGRGGGGGGGEGGGGGGGGGGGRGG